MKNTPDSVRRLRAARAHVLARPLVSHVLVAGAMASVPSLAHADTAITSPSDGTPVAGPATAIPTIAVTGTATTETAVDLRCAYDDGTGWIFTSPLGGGTNVPVVSGTFSAPAVTVPDASDICRLVALPAGAPTPTDLTTPNSYTGPRLRTAILGTYTQNNGGSAVVYDFDVGVPGLDSMAWIGSVSSYAIDETDLLTNLPGYAGQVYTGLNWIRTTDPVPAGQTASTTVLGVQVDGHNAYAPSSLFDVAYSLPINFSFGGHAHLTADVAVDSAGNIVVTENEAISVCATGSDTDYYPPAGATCTSIGDAGVAFQVRTRVTPSGRLIARLWKIVSTDGQAHTVHLVLRHGILASPTSLTREWRMPGETTYAPHANGDSVPSPTSGPYRIDVRSQNGVDGDMNEGKAAMIFTQPALELRFTGTRVLTPRFDLQVPATGGKQLAFLFCSGASDAQIEACVTEADALVVPTIAVSSPTDGSTVGSGMVTLSGTITDASDSLVFTVEGQTTAVANGGAFSTNVTLAEGANTITLVATNAYGVTTTKQLALTYTPGAVDAGVDGSMPPVGVDGGTTPGTGGSSGCSCTVAGTDDSHGTSALLAWLGVAGLVHARRRRRKA